MFKVVPMLNPDGVMHGRQALHAGSSQYVYPHSKGLSSNTTKTVLTILTNPKSCLALIVDGSAFVVLFLDHQLTDKNNQINETAGAQL